MRKFDELHIKEQEISISNLEKFIIDLLRRAPFVWQQEKPTTGLPPRWEADKS